MQWCHCHQVILIWAMIALHDQKCHFTPHFDHLDIMNAMVLLTIPSESYDVEASGVAWPKKSCCTSFWSSWPKEMVFASYNTDASANGIIWPRKSCCSSLLSSSPKNVMMPFIMLYASCETDTDPNGIIWHQHQWHHVMPMALGIVAYDQKKSCCSSFWLSWCKECGGSFEKADGIMRCQHQFQWNNMTRQCNGAIDSAISITCYLCQSQWQQMTKRSCCISFQPFWCKKWNGAIDDAISILWHWHKCQWHNMAKLYFISVVMM